VPLDTNRVVSETFFPATSAGCSVEDGGASTADVSKNTRLTCDKKLVKASLIYRTEPKQNRICKKRWAAGVRCLSPAVLLRKGVHPQQMVRWGTRWDETRWGEVTWWSAPLWYSTAEIHYTPVNYLGPRSTHCLTSFRPQSLMSSSDFRWFVPYVAQLVVRSLATSGLVKLFTALQRYVQQKTAIYRGGTRKHRWIIDSDEF